MFTIDQIKSAHSKVKSGADFPKYIQEIAELGVIAFNTYVNDGHTEYLGRDNFAISSRSEGEILSVAELADPNVFKRNLKIHQSGGTDYPTFRREAAETGVEKWTVSMDQMSCIYYDKFGNTMVEEKIPSP
ncbi:DUF1398 domain-containing protein [Pedobacter sp. HMF7647]|uniref:DUF1398 domain-containing protein n=1 Tax=Hufsiella arboris TaxID=2695275 RepID=A0A7K1YDE8_9SPHI|nr:DUF1398 family protein [Hufsiella arboris]MXV52068.1 DUF1398 domain-containing protein [Hufsiella arboris]